MMDAIIHSAPASGQLLLQTLVIPDIQQLEATGRFDRKVLLWLQDAYARRGIRENASEPLAAQRRLALTDAAGEELRQRETEWLTKITRDTYSAAKTEGRGFDLKQYVDAARTVYEAQSALVAGELQDLLANINASLQAGESPDVGRLSRESYARLARLAGAIGARSSALQAARLMQRAIEAVSISVGVSTGSSAQMGRQLLRALKEIADNPQRYVRVAHSHRPETTTTEPWDFAPAKRSQPGVGVVMSRSESCIDKNLPKK